MKKQVKVVAAIIENEKDEILCALRSPDMSIPNMWEFPGGKVEKGEDLFTALKREIDEELQCKVETETSIFNDNTHEYETFIINLLSIKCRIIEGTPTANEHSKLIWLKRENLSSLKWAPADIPAVEQLINEKNSLLK
ncbi:(deoxy)nucleoside triphosphate pyrophosphohydrolase [Peribacillus simplex]|uniref:8-oxo-dGTP diphosphatase n=1 Tax=Peribacillus simplex TaxID=1478 RepID=A0A9W4PA91_9BACI|nr:(deoxy)nucleoside triphosphate pyrophosphohydrolase [Peribacillus simplex]WHX90390.1 (deoxy)nucleoside triphosphate pyrophosphohydrolase [Peribacillus simplex]CAH0155435.1 CTP pyrophosphohydrolase [Peribacillus simplex]SNT17044.1 8-oxo-dGTP diphosphatase [Bacillus sp. OK838]